MLQRICKLWHNFKRLVPFDCIPLFSRKLKHNTMNRAIRFLMLILLTLLISCLISCLILMCLILSRILCFLALINIPSELFAFIPSLIRIIYARMSICLPLIIFCGLFLDQDVDEDEDIRFVDRYELLLENNPGPFQLVRFALWGNRTLIRTHQSFFGSTHKLWILRKFRFQTVCFENVQQIQDESKCFVFGNLLFWIRS